MSVTLICGINEFKSENLAGKSLDEVRREFRTAMNFPDGGEVLLNGERVSDLSTVLRAGDTAEWSKTAGEKGRA